MNQICYYTCNLLPPGFLAHAGHLPRPLLKTPATQHAPVRGRAGSRDAADHAPILPHANTCPFAVLTIDEGERTLAEDQGACLVVPTGCDAMRRAGDALAARYPDRVRTLLVPRTDDPRAVRGLARDLEDVHAWLESRAPDSDDATTRETASAENAQAPPSTGIPTSEGPQPVGGTFAYPAPPAPGGVFVVGGPLSHGVLLEAVLAAGVSVSGVESCRGPECATRLAALEARASTPAAVAAGILESATCPRSGALRRREFLQDRLRTSGAAAVLYARLPFCDPGAYDALMVRSLAEKEGLPFLEMEVDYPLEMAGPLRVRLEAFLETLTLDDSLLDDEDGLFDDPEPVRGSSGVGARSPVGGSAPRGSGPVGGSAPRGPGRRSAAPAGPLAGGGTRLAIAARSRVAAFRTGTARRRLEHHALSSTLGLYEPGAFVPWVSYLFPPELLASYDLTPLVPEVAAATLTGTEFRSDVEAAMNRLPLARDLCSYHRAAKAALQARLIPPPSVCLGTTPLCLGKEIMLDAVAAEFGVPFHSVRVPLPPDEGPTPADDVMMVADRLRELHDELGRLTGRSPRLDRAVAFSNRASVAWSELCAQRLDGSLVLNGRETFAFTFIGQLVWGSEEGAKGFERLRTERGRSDLLLANAANHRGNGGAHGNGGGRRNGGVHGGGGASGNGGPRPRLLWLHTMPHHDQAPFDLIAERGGAVVLEEMGQVHLDPLDPADPFPGMARRLIEHPLWGSAARRARLVLDLVRRGDVDGVVHFNHWGCRHGLGTLPVLRDSLAAAGIPFLAIDGDALDQPGHASNGAVKQLESFLEML